MAGVDVALGIAGIGVALPALAEKLLVKLHWDEIQATILFFATSCDRFDPTVRDLVEAHLQTLLKKFEVVILNLHKNLRPDNEIRRLRYAVFGKHILDDLINDLEKWQTRFLQYLQLITFTGHRLIDPGSPAAVLAEKAPPLKAFTRLQDLAAIDPGHNVVPNPPKESDYPDSLSISLRCCNVFVFPRPSTSPSAPTIDLLDRRYYDKDQDNVDYIRQIVRQTARILSAADPEAMGILPCRGFIHRPHLGRFDLVLSLPSTTTTYPRSLRDLLTDPLHGGHASHSLTERLFFAKRLAQAVFYMHTSKLVHKNIRPESILYLPHHPLALATPAPAESNDKARSQSFPTFSAGLF
ncbi:MAG: hypothetical protein Q9198_008304, partial [Flavoplaca austrocitrina]